MPRKSRYFLPDVPVHVVQRGHCRDPVFFDKQDYATYAHWMKESSKRYDVSIHSFVLMTNHTHLLVTGPTGEAISSFMQFLGRRYVPYINFKYDRSGTLWEGRFKASLVDTENYFLMVMRYIELNPVRANMVEMPDQYRWSSYCHNVGTKTISFIVEHPIYRGLGKDSESRQRAYRHLFESSLSEKSVKQITQAWLSGTPLGSEKFCERVETQLERKIGQMRRGRPRKIKKGL